jgi:Fe-S oxidoreductase
MAGSFGLEKEHYDISMSIGEMTLFPAIRAQQGEYVLAAEGVSCRQQIENGTGKLAKHVVEVLADAI